ncbi:MAG: GH32 C-terminal domain-containing protein [Mangrovibacterium sp.]
MKKSTLIEIICVAVLLLSFQPSGSFQNAVATWFLADLNDYTPGNSRLQAYGDVGFVTLQGTEAEASKARGGDGIAVYLNGGAWLDAGQGIKEELNLSGKNVSILIRMKADSVDGLIPLLTKAGTDQSVAYSIFLNRIGNEVYVESMLGSDEIGGAHMLKHRLPEEGLTQWHDILFRFNGKKSELYVDGTLCDDEVTEGTIRDWNKKPVLIGARYKQPYGYAGGDGDQIEATFKGLIDHVILWNRWLADDEVCDLSDVTALKDGRPDYYDETYRPQFHFSAKKNWLNDPNGLVYYNGVYHLFFQYMPPHRPGAYKDWGHAVSTDLVNWKQTPNHITPHKVWSGCWSGSAVVDFNNSAGFQSGKEKTIVAFITNGGNPGAGLGPLCTQCIAYSTDGGNTFTYYDQNPVIHNIYNANRDPKVVWDEDSKKWIMSLYMDKGNDFALFSSSNLKEWKQLSVFSLEGVAECPGFEALPVDGNTNHKKWLFFGANGNYMVGSFNGTDFKPETRVMRADYGKNFYAAQTWNNVPDGRCIHIAWMPTKRYPDMPFEQQMNFPTELTLRTTPQGIRVFRVPVREIQNLYDRQYTWKNKTLNNGDNLFKELKGDLFDIDVEIDPKNSTSFQIGARGATISYDVATRIISCGGPSVENNIIPENWKPGISEPVSLSNNLGEAPLPPIDGKIKLRILVDRTTIEVFGNDGEVVITSCFMPDQNNQNYSLTAKGKIQIIKAEVHALKSAWNK